LRLITAVALVACVFAFAGNAPAADNTIYVAPT
jgi:hypothetical protein